MADLDVVPKHRSYVWVWIIIAIAIVAVIWWAMAGNRTRSSTERRVSAPATSLAQTVSLPSALRIA